MLNELQIAKFPFMSKGLPEVKAQQFLNPITQKTFEALPEIYGRRKKKKYEFKYQLKSRLNDINDQQHSYHNCYTSKQRIHSNKQIGIEINLDNDSRSRRFKTQTKSYDKKYSELLSLPKEDYCKKHYCLCSKIHNQHLFKSQTNVKLRNRPVKIPTMRLPQINLNQPDDVQSKHKVVSVTKRAENDLSSQRNKITLLDMLRNSQGQSNNLNDTTSKRSTSINNLTIRPRQIDYQTQIPQKNQNVSVQTEPQNNGKEIKDEQDSFNHSKGKTEALHKASLFKSRKIASSCYHRIQNKNQDQIQDKQISHEQMPWTQDNPSFKLQKLKARYRQIAEIGSQSDDNKSVVSSISSASISKYVFDSNKKVNTMFHALKSKELQNDKSLILKKNQSQQNKNFQSKPFLYQKKNGLFVIPEQEEYVPFLKNYEPLSQKFAIKKLVRKPNFKVVPSNEGVYFGELIDEKKHGKGLMVTERHIFEGQYKNDLKTYGSQKNIDGVYKGQFVNGKREGFGSFEWNNGQTFQGEWKNGTKNGYGIWKSPKGDFYQGNWQLNRQHGKGIFKHRLSTYRGYFTDFLKQGQGEQIFSNGDKYTGTYNQGKPDGKGRYQWSDGSYYEGDFSNGVRQGKGKWVYINGTIYEGQFKNDFKDGEGRQTYKSGQLFQGTFKQGNKYEGVLYDANKVAIRISPTD